MLVVKEVNILSNTETGKCRGYRYYLKGNQINQNNPDETFPVKKGVTQFARIPNLFLK